MAVKKYALNHPKVTKVISFYVDGLIERDPSSKSWMNYTLEWYGGQKFWNEELQWMEERDEAILKAVEERLEKSR